MSSSRLHPTPETLVGPSSLEQSPFLKACRREPVPYTPVWLMRQAGRYMPEYRALKEKHGFQGLCKNSDLACEVTVHAAQRLGVDAAIIFSDLLLPLEPMGMRLEYSKGDGPVFHNPVRQPKDIENLRVLADPEPIQFLFDALQKTRRALPAHIPLLGFGGAPFTLAAYAIEGSGSDDYAHTKTLMREDPVSWHLLMKKLSTTMIFTLNEQIKAGAQAVQIFDSWVGCLSPKEYEQFVLPHTQHLIKNLVPGTPVIHFGTGTSALLELMQQAGGQVMGLDWRVELKDAWTRLGDVAVQGNMDPTMLLSSPEEIRREAKRILEQAEGRPGHIFNLGHGVLPQTPVDNALALVDAVHEFSKRSL